MSADNWAVCPQCEKNREASFLKKHAAYDTKVRDLTAQYGSMPPEEFVQRMTALKEPVFDSKDAYSNLREDWSIGIDKEFYVN